MDPSGPAGGASRGRGYPRRDRIRQGEEIRSLLRHGTRLRGTVLEVFTAPAPRQAPRFGVIIPRYGRPVVERNLLRRRIKEIGRTRILPGLRSGGCPVDVLVRVRPPAYETSFTDLQTDLTRLTEQLCSDASF